MVSETVGLDGSLIQYDSSNQIYNPIHLNFVYVAASDFVQIFFDILLDSDDDDDDLVLHCSICYNIMSHGVELWSI